jgi:hypothetical protein
MPLRNLCSYIACGFAVHQFRIVVKHVPRGAALKIVPRNSASNVVPRGGAANVRSGSAATGAANAPSNGQVSKAARS